MGYLDGETSPASAYLRSQLQDDTLCGSDGMRLHGTQVKVCDAVMWPDAAEGIVKQCLQGHTAGLVLMLAELSIHSYGSKWGLTAGTLIRFIRVDEPFDLAAWWRCESDGNVVVCLR